MAREIVSDSKQPHIYAEERVSSASAGDDFVGMTHVRRLCVLTVSSNTVNKMALYVARYGLGNILP